MMMNSLHHTAFARGVGMWNGQFPLWAPVGELSLELTMGWLIPCNESTIWGIASGNGLANKSVKY